MTALALPQADALADAVTSAAQATPASVPGWSRIRTEDPDALASFYSDMAERSLDQMAPGPCVVSAELGRCGSTFVFRES